MHHLRQSLTSRSKGDRSLPSQKSISRLVRTLRRRMGLTQEKLAARLGVAYPTVNRWENGRAKPSPLAMKQIEDLLGSLGNEGQRLRRKHLGGEGT